MEVWPHPFSVGLDYWSSISSDRRSQLARAKRDTLKKAQELQMRDILKTAVESRLLLQRS